MEMFLVVLIVALAAGWLFWRIRRSVRHPVCGGCGGCVSPGSRSASTGSRGVSSGSRSADAGLRCAPSSRDGRPGRTG